LAAEQMIGRTWRELGLPAATMEPVEAEWRQILATGQTVRREVDHGGDVHYEYLAFPLRAGGAIAGIAVISRDVTELVRARERYQSFVANSSEAIWRFELDEPIDALLPEDEQIDLAFARGYLGESIESDRFGNRKYFINSFIGVVECGRLVRAWGTQRDATGQKFSEQRLQALVSASAQVIWTSDRRGALQTITPTWTDLTGQSQE